MHLTREFSPVAYDFALASWNWLGVTDQVPRFTSYFGDVFLESPAGWWFLDTVEGTLEMRWRTRAEVFEELESADGRAEYLLEETLHQAEQRGMSLADDEVFAFVPPPAVTGTMAVENLAPLRFAIAASLSGRIHQQLRGAAAATPVLSAAPVPPVRPVPAPLPAWAPPSHVPPETTLTGSYPTAPVAPRARHFA